MNYIVKNDNIEKKDLQTYPFNKNGWVTNLFKNLIDLVNEIVFTVEKVISRLNF